jgi:hypothetical protein
MKKKFKFDIDIFRRYLILAAILLSGFLIIFKCYSFGGMGFNTPDMIEPISPQTHKKVKHDQDRFKRDRIHDRENRGDRINNRDRQFRDDYDAKKIKESCNRKSANRKK